MNPRHITYLLAAFGLIAGLHPEQCDANPSDPLGAIYGEIVSEDGADPGWVVFSLLDGGIVEICDSKASLPVVLYSMEYDGYIFPGLIDTHNHIGWNSVPMWRPGRLFNNRYEWRGDDGPDPVLVEDPEYVEKVQIPHKNVADAWLGSTSGYYAEIRACVGGTTMIQGANKPYPGSLARNLENYGVYSKVTDVTLASPGEIAEARGALYYGFINRLFLHVAEGVDPRSWSEFQFIDAVGLTMPGVAVIHGIPLTPDDFEIMAGAGMYLIWSPKSNLVLYGETADVVAALDAGVPVALGPDWSISGSDNLLEELKVAYEYSVEQLGGAITPKQLFKMATCDAALVGGVNDQLGSIEAGLEADLFLAPKFDPDPHRSLLKTYPKDIDLVLIDGAPVCGSPELMQLWISPIYLDEITVNHRKKMFYRDWKPFALVVDELTSVLGEMAPLVEDEPESKPGFRRNLPKARKK